MFKQKLVVGTRGSALALWQTEHVIQRLKTAAPALAIEVKTITTEGDVKRDRPLSQVGGKGLFVKEIEQALLTGEIDLAVHSLKDMPTGQPQGLTIGAVLERADPRDALVTQEVGGGLAALAAEARVGTSSLRRRAQLLAARPELQVFELRGNVDTRLRKLRAGEYDAVVLAAAGLIRLGYANAIGQTLPVDVMLPAAGQGALCVEVRVGDEATAAMTAVLDHPRTSQATQAERALLRRLEGGCQVPVGAYAEVADDQVHLRGLVASLDGTRLVRDEITGPAAAGGQLGTELAEHLLAAGADAILEEIRRVS